jgi:hypothetical protein
MPVHFSCPHCGLETLVDDEFAGQSGPCAGCGKEIRVPFAPGGKTTTARGEPKSRSATPRNVALLVGLSILAASIVFILLLTLVFPAFRTVGELVHKSQCRSNLHRIAQALRQYEIQHGTLPPAYIPDANGKPMHSWRVLILPQLGEHGLYGRYDFNEPWDGPNNGPLARVMPEVFACPADPDAQDKGETSYMVLVGPKTLFPGAKTARTGDITDDHATTILVAEIPVAGIVWTEPTDLNATRMQFMVGSGLSGEIGSYHARGAHVIMADDSVRFLDEFFASDYVEGMSTYQGGEDIPWEVLQ